jgi:hypothetical protein
MLIVIVTGLAVGSLYAMTGLVYNVMYSTSKVIRDDRRDLDAHADVDVVGLDGDAEALALLDQPAGALAARGDDHRAGFMDRPVGELHAARAPVAGDDARDRRLGEHRDHRLDGVTHAPQDVGGVVGAHVAYGRGDERQPVPRRLARDFVDLARRLAVDLLGGAVAHPHAVDVVHEALELGFGHELLQPAADLRREGELAV